MTLTRRQIMVGAAATVAAAALPAVAVADAYEGMTDAKYHALFAWVESPEKMAAADGSYHYVAELDHWYVKRDGCWVLTAVKCGSNWKLLRS
jgi:hypothetical protein